MDRSEFIEKMVSEKGFTLSDAKFFAKDADADIAMFKRDGKKRTYYDCYQILPPAIPAPDID